MAEAKLEVADSGLIQELKEGLIYKHTLDYMCLLCPTLPDPKPQPSLYFDSFNIIDKNDNKCATFIMRDEDHTLGNALHYVLMKNVPHPSEPKMNVRVQTTGIPATDGLRQGLVDLKAICNHILDTFDEIVPEDIHNTTTADKEKDKGKKKTSKAKEDVEMKDAEEEEEEEEEVEIVTKSKSKKGKDKKGSKSR